MIKYTLKCRGGHAFESWFQSAAAFDGLAAANQLTCPDCGGGSVEKALMAPGVAGSAAAPAASPVAAGTPTEHPLAGLRRRIEAMSDDVGRRFAAEARAMHLGDIPHRSIYGQAEPHEARSLIEDGIPIAPLPFVPKARTN